MIKSIHILFVLLTVFSNLAFGQIGEENWGTYLASYEDGKPGSTTLRMDLNNKAPFADYPFVLVTGITYQTSRDDGLPEGETFDLLHNLGDELIALIANQTPSIIVGSFTHHNERLEYFYIESDKGLEAILTKFYQDNYPDHEFYINIKEDKEWRYYREFLYPSEEILNYMSDESVVRSLHESGDPLTKERRVDHWMYFRTEQAMNKCKAAIIERNYQIESSGKNVNSNLPYELRFWKIQKVDMNSIYPVTSELRTIADIYNGTYDGWETSVEKE